MDKLLLQPEATIVAAITAPNHDAHSTGIRIRERAPAAIYDIQPKRGRASDAVRLIDEKYNIKLPEPNQCTTEGSLLTCCVGPDHWLIIDFSGDHPGLEHELEDCIAGIASVFVQSGALAIIQMEGPFVREALAKGVLLDLDSSTFGEGSAAVTSIAQVTVLFWKPDERPLFEFAVPRSLAAAFVEWLCEASLEFGR